MKTKNFIYAAFAGIILASCSSNDFAGDESLLENSGGGGAIAFSSSTPAITRAEGADAATKLNSQFIVWGEKNETKDAPAAGNFVFPDYKVAWTNNSAYTTTSNTKNWEYVGLSWTAAEAANITEATAAVTTNTQTIKYWDYAATSYTFTAVSAKPADISGGKVKINKLTSGTTVYDKGYEVDVTSDADLASLYFADRVNIAQSNDKDRTQSNKYGGNVTFTFRNAISQVRVAMYETIPGYDVKVTSFYYVDNADPTFATMDTPSTTNFVANVPNTATGVAGKFTVKYYPQSTENDAAKITNHPTISFAPTTATDSKNYITLGNQIAAAAKLGETSTAATYDKADSNSDGVYDFTTFFPQESNDKNLKLKIDYQLKNTVTNEVINITGKTAEIPAQYLQWKPNFKYTYLFKITDDELYPITFDAVVVEAEDGTAEYITTVSEPSITTFGTVTSAGKTTYVTGGNDYAAGTAVYATVMDGSSLATLDASHMQLYTVTTTDDTNFKITEASVAEALIEGPTLNADQANAAKIKLPTNPALTYQKTVPAEDGTTITLDASYNKAATFTTAASTTYALVYQKTAATYNWDSGKDNYTAETFAAAGALYTLEGSVHTLATSFTEGTKYYKPTALSSKGSYVVKIVTCPAP